MIHCWIRLGISNNHEWHRKHMVPFKKVKTSLTFFYVKIISRDLIIRERVARRILRQLCLKHFSIALAEMPKTEHLRTLRRGRCTSYNCAVPNQLVQCWIRLDVDTTSNGNSRAYSTAKYKHVTFIASLTTFRYAWSFFRRTGHFRLVVPWRPFYRLDE